MSIKYLFFMIIMVSASCFASEKSKSADFKPTYCDVSLYRIFKQWPALTAQSRAVTLAHHKRDCSLGKSWRSQLEDAHREAVRKNDPATAMTIAKERCELDRMYRHELKAAGAVLATGAIAFVAGCVFSSMKQGSAKK